MKKLLLIIFLVLFSAISYSQKLILFEVHDSKGKPIPNADICENDIPLSRTDSSGKALINFEMGNTKRFFSVKRTGYQTKSGIHINPAVTQLNSDTLKKVVILTHNKPLNE